MNKVKDAVPAPLKDSVAAKGKKNPKDETDHELEGLMSEIEGDLRADEFKKIWKSYGNQIIAFVVLLVLSVAAVQYYRQREAGLHIEAGRNYELALKISNDGKRGEAITQLDTLIKGGDEGYAALSRLTQAALQIQEKNIDGAIANYKALAADAKADPVLRDLAVLLRVLHSIDREDAKALEGELTPLTNPNNAFNMSALELSALLAVKQGDTARAVKILAEITSDTTVPPSMRERAEDLSKFYQSGVTPPPPTPAAVMPAAVAPAPVAPAPPAAPAAAPAPAAKPAADPAAKP